MRKSMPVFVVVWVALCAIGGLWFVGVSQAAAAVLKAGVARIDMTPPLELNAPLGGYGERMNGSAKWTRTRMFSGYNPIASFNLHTCCEGWNVGATLRLHTCRP